MFSENLRKVVDVFRYKPFISYMCLNLISLGLFISLIYILVIKKVIATEEVQIQDKDVNYNEEHILVEISGAVFNPGVYELDSSARLNDLVLNAGGFLEEAAGLWISKNMNLSQKIADSQKIYIPFAWDTECVCESLSVLKLKYSNVEQNAVKVEEKNEYPTDDVSYNKDEEIQDADRINVNKASSLEIEKLNGIGPAYAQRIIDNRPYADFDELVEKSKVPKSTLEKNINLLLYEDN